MLGEVNYTAARKKRMAELMIRLGLEKDDDAPFVILRRNRGQLLRRPKTGGIEIVAEGRADWAGSLELQEDEAGLVTCPITVDPFKELLIVHPSAVDDARSSNQLNGPWSFRRLISEMTPDGSDPADFVLDWLNQWRNVSTLNGFAVEPDPSADRLPD